MSDGKIDCTPRDQAEAQAWKELHELIPENREMTLERAVDWKASVPNSGYAYNKSHVGEILFFGYGVLMLITAIAVALTDKSLMFVAPGLFVPLSFLAAWKLFEEGRVNNARAVAKRVHVRQNADGAGDQLIIEYIEAQVALLVERYCGRQSVLESSIRHLEQDIQHLKRMLKEIGFRQTAPHSEELGSLLPQDVSKCGLETARCLTADLNRRQSALADLLAEMERTKRQIITCGQTLTYPFRILEVRRKSTWAVKSTETDEIQGQIAQNAREVAAFLACLDAQMQRTCSETLARIEPSVAAEESRVRVAPSEIIEAEFEEVMATNHSRA